MNIEQFGNGPRVFLGVHGWAGSHRTFRVLTEDLPKDVTFYSVDLPGYGRSPTPPAWELNAVAGELAHAIRSVALSPIELVGYCAGGNIAMLAARQAGMCVKRLVLIDPFAYMPLYFRIFTWGEFGRRAYRSTFASARGRKWTNAALHSKRAGQTDLTRSFENVDHDHALNVLRAFAQMPPSESFSTLNVKVDILYGERSFKAIKRSVHRWQQVWPHARAYPLAGAGHEPLREATDLVRAIVFRADAPNLRTCAGSVADSGNAGATKRLGIEGIE